jgi:hypothetical protein
VSLHKTDYISSVKGLAAVRAYETANAVLVVLRKQVPGTGEQEIV